MPTFRKNRNISQRRVTLVLATALLAPLVTVLTSSAANAKQVPHSSSAVTVINDASFSSPSAITSSGADVWVANSGGTSSNPSVSEINATTGAVTAIKSPFFMFPNGIVADGSIIWVADGVGGPSLNGSVEEINATTDAVTQLNDPSFNNPVAIASSGADVWVANQNGGPSGSGSVSEINATTGAVTVINDPSFNSPAAIAADATHVWVANSGGGAHGNGSVSEITIATGTVTQINDASINNPNDISDDGTNVWVANIGGGSSGTGSLSKINASTGAVTAINSPNFDPYVVVSNGTDVWVSGTDSVAQYLISSGASVRITDPSLTDVGAVALDGSTLWLTNASGGASGNGSVVELVTTAGLPKPTTLVPGAPTALHAQAGALSVHLSWRAPAYSGQSVITRYVVRSHPGNFTCTTASTSCTVSGLKAGVSYTFTVTASSTNGPGKKSKSSNAVKPTALRVVSVGGHPPVIDFAVPAALPKATIGTRYVSFSFCRPGVASGNFCGGSFNHPTNPRGGPADENYDFSTRSVSPAQLGCHCFKPVGLNVDFRTGLLSGTPAAGDVAGTYHFMVCAQVVFDARTMHCGETSIVLVKKKSPPTTTTTTMPPIVDAVSPAVVQLGSIGGCTGGALTTTIQITAASNVTWSVYGDSNNTIGQVATGNGAGSGSFTVTMSVPPQTPTFDCTYTIPMARLLNVDVKFSDGQILGTTVYFTYIFVE